MAVRILPDETEHDLAVGLGQRVAAALDHENAFSAWHAISTIRARALGAVLRAADLVPVDRVVAREAGFLLPLALTPAAYEDCVAWTDDDSDRTGALQDEAGRLWDVVGMAAQAARGQSQGRIDRPLPFRVYRVARTLDRGEAAEREWAGELLADLVQLVVRRVRHTVVIDFAWDGTVA